MHIYTLLGQYWVPMYMKILRITAIAILKSSQVLRQLTKSWTINQTEGNRADTKALDIVFIGGSELDVPIPVASKSFQKTLRSTKNEMNEILNFLDLGTWPSLAMAMAVLSHGLSSPPCRRRWLPGRASPASRPMTWRTWRWLRRSGIGRCITSQEWRSNWASPRLLDAPHETI